MGLHLWSSAPQEVKLMVVEQFFLFLEHLQVFARDRPPPDLALRGHCSPYALGPQ